MQFWTLYVCGAAEHPHGSKHSRPWEWACSRRGPCSRWTSIDQVIRLREQARSHKISDLW